MEEGFEVRCRPHLVEHDVVQLEVPVDHAVLVEEEDADGDLGAVEPATPKLGLHLQLGSLFRVGNFNIQLGQGKLMFKNII